MKKRKFHNVVASPLDIFSPNARKDIESAAMSLSKFLCGDWGKAQEKKANDHVIKKKVEGIQIVGRYPTPHGDQIVVLGRLRVEGQKLFVDKLQVITADELQINSTELRLSPEKAA